LDASKSVAVAGSLLSSQKEVTDNYIADVRSNYAKIRTQRKANTTTKKYVSLEEARRDKLQLDWTDYLPPIPVLNGIEVLDNYDLEDLSKYIDWTPFFSSWQLKGKYPAILEDKVVGEEASKLFDDAKDMLQLIISEGWLTAKGVVGIFPANAEVDDVVIYSDEDRKTEIHRITNLRQQRQKAKGLPYFCLSDFLAPVGSVPDYIGGFAVTTGIGIEKKVKEFEASGDDYNAILLKSLADRLAEAFAERLHQLVRTKYWNYTDENDLTNDQLIKEKYQGIRPAPGYPACPDHSLKNVLFELLAAEKNTGIYLTESLAMYPAASVSGFYYSHPQSKYFGLGQISKDQVTEYSNRNNIDVEKAEKTLFPSLNYKD